MCNSYRWVISCASIIGMIQSLVWMGLGISTSLIYLCVIKIPPYTKESDFFKVTMVKLYFEGPKCIPDGSYLGQFNEDYRKKLDLFTPDKVFAVMTAYVILNIVYFILSITLYKYRLKESKRAIVLGWSCMTLVMCTFDGLVTYELILDVFSLQDYMADLRDALESSIYSSSARRTVEIPYFPLTLAVVTSRFFALWLWNLIIGCFLLLDSLCLRIITTPKEKNPKVKDDKREIGFVENAEKQTKDRPTSVSLLHGKATSVFDIRSNPDYLEFRKSGLEGVTRFSNTIEGPNYHPNSPRRGWSYTPSDGFWPLAKSQSSKEWEMTNEGFENDEATFAELEKRRDFGPDDKNFGPEQRKIKIVKHPVGKSVSIPVPPPLPTSGSCNC